MIDGYLAVGNKCAVDLARLVLPIRVEEALAILWRKGFRVVTVDLVAEARSCISHARYCRGAASDQAPFVVDCSSLTKWLYSRVGIWLPRHSIDQREMGVTVQCDEVVAGDLVFTSGWKDYWHQNQSDGVGHVGMITDTDSVIHAANSQRNIVEDSLADFMGSAQKFRGIRRIKTHSTITLESPSNRVVEWSGEIRNIILQNLIK